MDATLWQHLAASLTRIVLALLAAVVIGIPVGIAMGLSPTVRGILDPVIELYRPVPPLAYLPLMVIWFGIGETSKDLTDLFSAIFATAAMSALAGVKTRSRFAFVPPSRWEPAVRRCCGLSFCPARCRKSSPDYALVWVWAGLRW